MHCIHCIPSIHMWSEIKPAPKPKNRNAEYSRVHRFPALMYTETGDSICNSCAVFYSFSLVRLFFASNIMWASWPRCLCWWLDTRQRKNEHTKLIEKGAGWELDKEKMMTWKTGLGGNREGLTIRAHLGKHTHSVILYFSEISHVSTVQSRLTGSWPEKFQVWTFYRCFSVWSPT